MAAGYYNRAISRGKIELPWPLYQLGTFFENERGVERNIARAMLLYDATDPGHCEACHQLAEMVRDGAVADRDWADALPLSLLSVEDEDAGRLKEGQVCGGRWN